CIHSGFGLHEFKEELAGPEYAQRFVDQVDELGIEYILNTMVIELTPDKEIIAMSENGLVNIGAKSIVLAMGCRERTAGAVAMNGYRPAGVYTAGMA
ncbi:pyridine nucleotide-disulfide oxidoreductase, partial [Flavonifractor sp. DFI.6.63]|nr:pyridine nucleotide-disulfide oxidoreductase [Flavonifractor sp. DFI.6.63]